ncbi:Uncharacterised protein [Mycobacteroides abscessus subsp. abscessus]|nr:Uncharacterised protein [Mycobacteroides abscessus subsp. abscessus]
MYEVPGWLMKYSVSSVGASSSKAEKTVQLRPPKRAVATV